MGDVKDAVKGSKKISPSLTQGNLVERVSAIYDELSELIQKKDEDALNEGADKKAENTRKAGTLRAVATLLVSARTLLEDY